MNKLKRFVKNSYRVEWGCRECKEYYDTVKKRNRCEERCGKLKKGEPVKLIENLVIDNQDKSITEAGHDLLTVRDCIINIKESNPNAGSAITGFDIRKCDSVEINNVVINARNLKRKYGYALRSGYSDKGAPIDGNKLVKISNCNWSGFGPPNAGYNLNRDVMALEAGDEVWIKDSVFSGASDAIIDCKIRSLKAARCLISDSYRLSRLWKNVTQIFSDCIFDGQFDHFWFYDNTGKVILHNCVFKQPMKTSFDQSAGVIEHAVINPLKEAWFGIGAPVPPIPPSSNYAKFIALQEKRILLEIETLAAWKELKD